jgi:hypothetical protein
MKTVDTDLLDKLLKVGADLRPQTFRDPAEPPHIYYRRTAEGDYTRVVADPKPRTHVAASIDTLAQLAAQHEDTAEIWYSRAGLTLFLDKTERRNVVTMPVELSPQIRRLMELEQNKPAFQQGALIKELRITFAGCLSPAGNIVEVLRRVKFNATQSSDQAIEHGKSSLGKQITAQVTGTGVLPEEVTFDVPVFASARFGHIRQPVTLALEPDAATCQFQLIPLPGRVEVAVSMAESDLGRDIRDALDERGMKELIPVYFGKAQ